MSLPPFDAFLEREMPQSLVSVFCPRHFALQADDQNNPFGHEPEIAHLLDLLILDCIQGVTYPRPIREASDRRPVGGHFG